MKKGLFYYMLIACLCACQKKTETISTASLLKEMVDCEALAKYPEPYYETRQFSSYDRASVKKDSVSWYANCDRSQFLRVDSIDGRREFVLVDTDGPGAITRFWVTVAAYSDKGTLRFYLDNQEVPEIGGEVLGILSGHALVDAPLSASVSELTDYKQRGHNLYLPIPYAKHCKITYESPSIKEPGEFSEECFYYNINYRTYAEGTSVATFSKEDIKQNAKLLADVQRKLTVSRREIGGLQKEPMLRSVLAAGEERDMTLSGPGAVRRLDVKLHAGDFDQALRSTVLRISFDGNETVWVPVGDFFGSVNRLSPFQTFYTEVTSDSLFSCFWVMPYQKDCRIALQNVGTDEVEASLTAYTSAWKWDERSMYFGAGWTEFSHLHTRTNPDKPTTDDHFEVNFVKLTGRGVYVGDGVTLFNSLADWWGEGDEKVYVNGEEFPSHFGTGTEDYYGYAWCMHNVFSHPFIAEPDGTGSTQCGHVSNVRYRGLDAIPFSKSLTFDMEIWHWGSTVINYAPTTFWYMLPGGASNRRAEAAKASADIAKHKNDLVSNVAVAGRKVEGEYLDIRLTGGIERSQSIPAMNWSNGAQFFWAEAKEGDKASLGFKVDKGGNYRLKIAFTVAPDYGCIDLYLNNHKLKENLNLYSTGLATNVLDLGTVTLQDGSNELLIIQKKADSRSANSLLGMDYLIIQ